MVTDEFLVVTVCLYLTLVALSRAKHGLYILGNAQNLTSRSPMWRAIIEELEARQELGEGLPVACNRHPETKAVISKPGQLPRFAPDGKHRVRRLYHLC
jgi:hypothetical protein